MLRLLAFFTKDDQFHRIVVFTHAGRNKTQEQILLGMMGFYPPDTRYGLLAMDMDEYERRQTVARID